jgi:hypothetical protein
MSEDDYDFDGGDTENDPEPPFDFAKPFGTLKGGLIAAMKEVEAVDSSVENALRESVNAGETPIATMQAIDRYFKSTYIKHHG